MFLGKLGIMMLIIAFSTTLLLALEEWPVEPAKMPEPETAADVAEKLTNLQDRFARLALAYDVAIVGGLQVYPQPDWALPPDIDYLDVVDQWAARRREPTLARRIDSMRMGAHYDVLALFPSPLDGFTTQTLNELRQYELMRDPFAPNLYLGYIATTDDYYLISAGPDGKRDIMTFDHMSDGRYSSLVGLRFLSREDLQPLAEELWSKFNLSNSRVRGRFDIKDVNLIYDPTNGAFSSGDIIFHRRGGDNWMFSYAGNHFLDRRNLHAKDLRNAFGDDAEGSP